MYDKVISFSNHLREQIKNGEEVDNGATFKPKGEELSKGCQACKNGGWLCIYLSIQCNKTCDFCPQYRDRGLQNEQKPGWIPRITEKPEISIFETLQYNHIKGISFSGGEPFLQLHRTQEGNPGIYEWLDAFNNLNWDNFPYIWLYTNGNLVTDDNIQKLIDKGVKEIRFNLAANNYDSKIFKKMEMVRKKIHKLSVEVPVLSYQLPNLLDSLKIMENLGVDYLNLHELALTEYNWNYLIKTHVDPKLIYSVHSDNAAQETVAFYLPSLIDIYTVIRYIDNNNINLIYNDCSGRNYKRQDLSINYLHNKLIDDVREFGTWKDFVKRNEMIGDVQ
jgi:uncharacterized protein